MASVFFRLPDRDSEAAEEPRSELSKEPIHPDIGVNGWTLLWALIGIVLFLYHWGRVLVFASGFVLSGTPYALVEAGGRAPRPLEDDDVVLIRRGVPSLVQGQILLVGHEGRKRLARLLFIGPGSVPGTRLAFLDRVVPEEERSRPVEVTDQQIMIGVAGDGGDTLGQIVPRHFVLGRAERVVLPPHRFRSLL